MVNGVNIYVEETQKSNYNSGDSILHLCNSVNLVWPKIDDGPQLESLPSLF